MILNAFEYVKQHTENESTGHDYHHAVRVYKMALELAAKKK
jgi:HD superfamily phosphodiesterase